MASVLDLVRHYQSCIEKYTHDEQKVLKCIDKLFNLGVTVQHLQETGVGRTVNALRKEPGEVGQAARSLVYKWKLMVAAEESDQEDQKTDTSTYNGHGSGKESDDNAHPSQTHSERYGKSNTAPKENKDMNGSYSGKRKYHSSEEEEATKKRKNSSSSESDYKKPQIKKHESESDSSDNSHSNESESDASDSSQEEVKIKQEIKKEPTSSHRSSSSSAKNSSQSDNSDYKSSVKKSHEADKHSRHHSSHSKDSHSEKSLSKEKSHSSDKSSGHSSSKHDNHGSDKHKSRSTERHSSHNSDKHKSSSSEKTHKSENKNDLKESKSSKHSLSNSEKHRSSSSQKTSNGSDKHRSSSKDNKSEKQKSSHKHDSEPGKHKSSTEKEVSKHKSKESASHHSSSVEKHHSSSKDNSKEKSSSSKEKSSSDKKHEHKSSSSGSKVTEKNNDKSSDKKSSSKSSSSTSHKSEKSGKCSSSSKKEDKPKKKVQIVEKADSDDGFDCGSGASFADVLGMISPAKPKKKSGSSHLKDMASPNSDLSPATLLAPTAKLAPLPALEISGLPEISPNYKPRPPPRALPHFLDEDAMNAVISSKNQRTKVYSGNKVIGKVTSLYEMCVHVLQEHIDALEFTGGVPYEILKPVVDRATPNQLFMLEYYNNYLMEDTDHLWQAFCQKTFRRQQRQEMETWREMYARCQEEQECKLKSLTANIRIAQEAKNAPVKQTKMAYIDSIAKPPRNIAKKQAAHGTARVSVSSPAARVASLAASSNVLRGGVRPTNAAPVSVSSFNKPKKAPLMAKALQIMRGRKR